MPGDHVQPEGGVDGWAGGEVCQLLADLAGEQAKQALAAESADWDVAGDGPAAQCKQGWQSEGEGQDMHRGTTAAPQQPLAYWLQHCFCSRL